MESSLGPAPGGARIRCRHSEPPPPYAYAITLELIDRGEWHTVRLWDNADELDEHHEHAYTRSNGKQEPRILEFASANEAMAAAIAEAKRNVKEIVEQWRAS
jgi:predicted transcriptional regulator